MDQKTFLENFGVIADAPDGIEIIRKVIVQAAIGGHLSNLACVSGSEDPAGWSTLTANQVFTSRSGNSKLIKGKLYNEPGHGQFPGFSASGQDVWLDTWEHEGCAAILSAVGARCGKAFLATGKWSAIANTHIIWIPTETILPEFAMLILNNEDFWIRSGTAQPFVKVKATLERTLGIPPLEEQLAILAQVDELMALCDELEAEKAKRERLRTAARASAIDAISTAATPEELSTAWSRISCNWELVCDSFDSISSLRTLLVDLSIQGQLFGRQELGEHGYPKKWDVPNFRELCDIEGGNQPPKSTFVAEPRAGYVQLFQIRDLGSNPVPVFIPEELAKSTAKEGDILIGRYGASVGKVFRAQEGAYNVALVKFTYPKDRLNPDFVFWLLKSTRSQALFTGMTRSAQAGFNKRDLAPLLIPIPSLEEQVRIVSRLNELMTICGDLEGRLKKRTEIESAFAHASSRLLTV